MIILRKCKNIYKKFVIFLNVLRMFLSISQTMIDLLVAWTMTSFAEVKNLHALRLFEMTFHD